MKTLKQIEAELESLEKVFGFNPLEIGQQSPEWHIMKLGVMSASHAKTILAKSSSQTKKTYISQLVAQVLTGQKPDISAKALDWGNQHEDAARAAYEFEAGVSIKEYPFIFKDHSLREGASPDGLIFFNDGSIRKGTEIKCPFNSENYVKFVCDNKIKDEHEKQCQFSMHITDAEEWDYGNYDPRAAVKQLHWYTFERDDKTIALFEEATKEIAHEMDKMLATFGLEFGDQWRRLKKPETREVKTA